MKNLVRSIALGAVLAAPMLANASVVPALGTFPGSASFGNSTVNPGAGSSTQTLASSGAFTDEWKFSVGGPNIGNSSQVGVTGASITNIADIGAIIVGVTGQFPVVSVTQFGKQLAVGFGALPVGDYILRVTGTVSGLPASYSGTLDIQTPIPGAVWLFGSALAGVMGVAGRKKSIK